MKTAKENGNIYLAAHRGVCGANVPCNSLEAYKAALNQGADIVEMDVEATSDGHLFVQHPGMEHVHLGLEKFYVRNHTATEVRGLKLLNSDHTPTQYSIPTFEDALELLRGKCYINVDKFWSNPDAIAKVIRGKHMEDQVIVKGTFSEEFLRNVEAYAPDLPCMPIVREEDVSHEILMRSPIRYIGNEVIFSEERMPVASQEYLDKLHADGKVAWVNALVYDYRTVLAAGHNDDVSVIDSPEIGWGWLADRGFDIIQTDFLSVCRAFLAHW